MRVADILARVQGSLRGMFPLRVGCSSGGDARLFGMLLIMLLVMGIQGPPASDSESITVCQTDGCDHPTIQAAIDAASPGDTIRVLDDEHTESDIFVNKRVTIAGGSTAGTTVQAAEARGGADDRVFEIAAGAEVAIEDMTIRHGRVVGGPARGGGILNHGVLKLERVTITENDALGSPGGPGGRAEGGGIYNEGVLDIGNCTISSNEARGGYGASYGDNGGDAHGGGLFGIEGRMTIVNSTVSGNVVSGGASGGG